MCNIHKQLLGTSSHSARVAHHLNLPDNKNPPVTTASTVRRHFNMAVPTGHAQSMTKVCKLLRIIFKILKNGNSCDPELLAVRHIRGCMV